jgi:hypothetical protein
MARRVNIQNLVKEQAFQNCLVAPEGHRLIYLDFNSIEPTITAYFTQDPGLLSIYGPDAKKPNCIYLFCGAGIDLYKDDIRKWYDPDNPTPEGVKNAKKYAADTRQKVKPAYLGWQYGLGAYTLSVDTGIPLPECKKILEDIDKTFYRVPQFNEMLKRQWRETGGYEKVKWVKDESGMPKAELIAGAPGYIVNGRGRPLAIAPGLSKDCCSRFIQSTGHDILMRYYYFINKLRRERKTPMRPFHVDQHDATIWSIPEERVDEGIAVYEEAKQILNDELGWSIKIEGDVETGVSLGDFLKD